MENEPQIEQQPLTPIQASVMLIQQTAHQLQQIGVEKALGELQAGLISNLSANPHFAAEQPKVFLDVVSTIEYLQAGNNLVKQFNITATKQTEGSNRIAAQAQNNAITDGTGHGEKENANPQASSGGEAPKEDIPSSGKIARRRSVRNKAS